ncbi:DUF397 domain-containing protein [Streptomyces apocyni]|uniref:DUF397 domain-containing protein n=1 Tax=Streptomyces apocyni TaxID=2654677 RepID=UPI0012E9F0B7|nr:DUF397 domain-containing protein [Streptomyces apocyni]
MIRKTSAGDASELEWFKSSYSDSSNINDCVEVAVTQGAVYVRDSKNTVGPQLALTPTAWAGLVSLIAHG